MEPRRCLHVTVRNFKDLLCGCIKKFQVAKKTCQQVLVLGHLQRELLNLTLTLKENKQKLSLLVVHFYWTRITVMSIMSLLCSKYCKDWLSSSAEEPLPAKGPPSPSPLLSFSSHYFTGSWVSCCSSSTPALQPLPDTELLCGTPAMAHGIKVSQ